MKTNLVLIVLCFLVLVYGCKSDSNTTPPPTSTINWNQAPTVTVGSTTSAQVSATMTAGVTGQSITWGYVWSKTNASPTLSDNRTAHLVTVATVPYVMNDSLTGLEANTTYFVRAYLTSTAGTAYSSATTFQVKITLTLTDAFAQTLTSLLQNRDIGYGFTIYENDQMLTSGSGGLKSRAVDAEGTKPYTIDTKMHIASMSKTIAAMAFTQLAAQKGIRTTDKISTYLPASWAKGENIDQISFLDLFNHRSGIIGLGNTCLNGSYSENIYSGLKQLIAKGVSSSNRGKYCYQNANVGLMRILIPAIAGYVATGNDATDDQQTQQLYLAYVQKNIFEKVGLMNIIPTYPTGDPTYTYTYPYPAGQKGWNPGNFMSTLGAYGWYLTPREAGKLYATVLSSTDQSVLPAAYKDTLLLNNLGCFRIADNSGNIAYHDGWWYIGSQPSYQGLRTVWMKFPNNMTVVLFVNALSSQTGLFPSDNNTDIVPFVVRAYTMARQLSGGRAIATPLVLEHPEPH